MLNLNDDAVNRIVSVKLLDHINDLQQRMMAKSWFINQLSINNNNLENKKYFLFGSCVWKTDVL